MNLWERIWTYFACALFVVLGFGMIGVVIESYIFNKACVATLGEFDNSYIRQSNRFISSYGVKYYFNYGGQLYEGHETIYDKPLIRETIVYFLPNEPNKSRLDRGRIFESLIISFINFFCLAQTIKILRRKNEKKDLD